MTDPTELYLSNDPKDIIFWALIHNPRQGIYTPSHSPALNLMLAKGVRTVCFRDVNINSQSD